MTKPTVLPVPEPTYQLLLDAARAWPGDRLVVTVAGVDPDQLADAVEGFAITVRATP